MIKNKKKLSRGDGIIATNLAGRGTNIKVEDAVNESGGLLCLVTFLARNRRVELQAFGRTTRAGNPGSVCCILDASAMLSYYSGLDIQIIRKMRGGEEKIRLNLLSNRNLDEILLKEKLFKDYCNYLSEIYSSFRNREDLTVVVDSTNKNWGAWLETKQKQIQQNQQEELLTELSTMKQQWMPTVPSDQTTIVQLPLTNFYHLVQFGNRLITEETQSNMERAIEYYTQSIQMESRYGLIAYYNRAYCRITNESTDYKTLALADIEAAAESVDKYMDELSLINTSINMVNQVRVPTQQESDVSSSEVEPQNFTLQVRLNLKFIVSSRIN